MANGIDENQFRETIRLFLPASVKRWLKFFLNSGLKTGYWTRCFINKHLLWRFLLQKTDKLHLGCGNVRFNDFINVDCRATLASDIIHDCVRLDTFFPKNSFQIVYSNAFFEHLSLEGEKACLAGIYRILHADGKIVFTGIPDFQRVAQAYLNEDVGVTKEKFDIFEAYRFTHGAPEETKDFWVEQVHKSLLDKNLVEALLKEASFASYCIFNYCYKEEKVPVNLGFIGFKQKPAEEITPEWLAKFLAAYPTSGVNKDTLNILPPGDNAG